MNTFKKLDIPILYVARRRGDYKGACGGGYEPQKLTSSTAF